MSLDDPRHGTRAGYMAGCRQDCCRAACARYERGRQWDILCGRPRTMPVLGARRRIQALQRIGWSSEYLSERLGYSRAWLNVTLNRNGARQLYRRNFEQIAALYDELCMTPGPSAITRRRAERAGWAPPLAWDDIDNDPEPQGVGYVSPDRAEALHDLAAMGVGLAEACRRLEVGWEALERWCTRHGMYPIYVDLVRRDRRAA